MRVTPGDPSQVTGPLFPHFMYNEDKNTLSKEWWWKLNTMSVVHYTILFDFCPESETDQDPVGLQGTKAFLCTPFLVCRKYASFSLHDLPWITKGRFKQLLIRKGGDSETRGEQSSQGGDGGGGLGVGISRCKPVHIEWINNKVLLYSTGNYISILW